MNIRTVPETFDTANIQKIALEVRQDLEVIAGSDLTQLRGEIEQRIVRAGFGANLADEIADVLSYMLTQGWVEVNENDEVLVPVRPEALTKIVAKALATAQDTHTQQVRARVSPSKKVRGWHLVSGIQKGFVEVGGKSVRLDPTTLTVTTPEKESHGEVYFSNSSLRRNQYATYIRLVGIPNAVTPYEWMIRGWFAPSEKELVNSNPKVIEHRRAKAALWRVDAEELYGDYWQESEDQ